MLKDMRPMTRLWIGVLFLALSSPLGLALPRLFKAGSAWGEWGVEEIRQMAGYVPQGLQRLADIWNAAVPDYAFKGWETRGIAELSLAYVCSAGAGVGIVALIVYLAGKLIIKNRKG